MLLILWVALCLGSVLADEPQYPFPVNCEEPRWCTPDLIPYCIKGRDDSVYGPCDIQDTKCELKTTTLSIVMLMILLAALALGSVLADEPQYPFAVNCEEPRWCTPDLIPYCIKGRDDPVYGHCDIQDAICNGEELDPSNSCFLSYPVRCDHPADQRACFRDLLPWCVVGRTEPVRGHCAIQEAICDENAVLDVSRSCMK